MSLLPSGAIETGGYNINNSLRFRSSASAYLSRTPASNGDRQKWTFSGWVKRGASGVRQGIFIANPSGAVYWGLEFDASNALNIYDSNAGGTTALTTTALYRDFGAWYHVVVAVDTTQATASNRCKIYVNGNQVTSFVTTNYPTQNSNTQVNTASVAHYIGNWNPSVANLPFDGYMADVNFIDGQALTPSSFGETDTTTGVWKPKAYSGTYGTNGFYLKFSDIATTSGSNAGLGKDFSGNSNYWTTNNISVTSGTTYDAMTDVPTNTSATVANYCVLNPLNTGSLPISGNLGLSHAASSWRASGSTILQKTGKWYFEGFMESIAVARYIGIGLKIAGAVGVEYVGQGANSWGIISDSTNLSTYTGNVSTNATVISATTSTAFQVAVDFDAGKMWFGYNNTWLASGNPSTGANPTYTFTANTELQPILASFDNTNYINFGQRPFAYTPPTGFVALNTYNFPDSTIKKGDSYMDATTYTGNGTSLTVTNASAFKPDFVWVKNRGAVTSHVLQDSVRGAGKSLFSNSTSAESGNTGDLITSFNSNGFTVNDTYLGGSGGGGTNGTSNTYVGWQWQAGQGSTSSNTSGSITSTVSVNTTAGFSVVTYTGTGANATVGHGLGVAPKMIIVKWRSSAGGSWATWHSSFVTASNTDYLLLDSTLAKGGAGSLLLWNNTAPTSSVFSIGTNLGVNTNTGTYVAYCWAEIAGFSRFGSYTGNGSTDGPFVYTGFRPKFVLVKASSGAESWYINDSARDTFNPDLRILAPNLSDAEFNNGTAWMDLTSNGFKIRYNASPFNTSGATYIYMAFAENPFKNSLAR